MGFSPEFNTSSHSYHPAIIGTLKNAFPFCLSHGGQNLYHHFSHSSFGTEAVFQKTYGDPLFIAGIHNVDHISGITAHTIHLALLQIVGGDKLIILLLMELHMNPFKGRHFQRDIILWAVRWYCKYGISYRELQEMLAERGVNVDHSTIYRWVQRYAPEMEKRLRWYWRNPSDLCPWHMDETYVKVNGRWAYLYRAVDSRGRTVDFYLSSRRNSKAAYRFLGKILNNVKKWQIPRFINTDKAPAYGRALALLKREGRCPSDVEHRQIKYRNNVIECDHGKLKRIIGATLGFKSMKTAYATIKGIEVMRALRKGQASAFYYGDPLGEMRLVSRVFEM